MYNLTKSRRHFFRIGAIAVAGLAARAATAAEGRHHDWEGWHSDHDHDHGHHDHDGHHCFRAGTKIRTIDGDIPIEELKPGDKLPLFHGSTAEIQEVAQFPLDSPAVLIFPDALAYRVPTAPLFVSSMHALAIDWRWPTVQSLPAAGILVTAGSLINGETIILQSGVHDAPYYHIKLARHGVIFAENAPCETLRGKDEEPCLPLHSAVWRRQQIASHARSAISPIIDVRLPVDVIRDQLEERAFA